MGLRLRRTTIKIAIMAPWRNWQTQRTYVGPVACWRAALLPTTKIRFQYWSPGPSPGGATIMAHWWSWFTQRSQKPCLRVPSSNLGWATT